MDKVSGFTLVSIFVIVFMAGIVQAAAPVSPPESRFVWEPGENLTFTWINENFDGFYYEPWNWTGKEILTIKLDNIEDRYIPNEGLVYSTTVETATARYRPFGEYALIWFMGVKHLAGFPEGKSNITTKSGIDPGRLYKILIDDDASYSLALGSNLTLSEGYVLEIIDVNVTGACVIISLKKDEIKVDTGTRKVEAGKNYIYETPDGTLMAVHIDSVFEGKEKASVAINGIFQVSQYETLVGKADNPLGVMWVTNISNDTITLKNAAGIVELKPGQIINIINNVHLKVADSNTLRIHLYKYIYWYSENKYMYWYSEKIEHRGVTGSNNFMALDGLNYAGFLYEADSGNYSESLVITNMTGRRIPEGGLTYTSYSKKMPYAVNEIKGIKPNGTDGSYVTFSLGGNKYAVKSNGLARILIEHGDIMSEKKELAIPPNEFYGKPWELGEGYSLTVTFIDPGSWPRKARLVLGRNGAKLDDVNLSGEYAYSYFKPGENGTPKLITYLESAFAGSTYDLIQLRYTWFVSDDIIQIKEGDRLGVFNVTVVEPDRMVLINREPIELKAGSSINLLGNRSFFVENSDELRFYPTNMGGTQVMPEGILVNEGADNIHDVTTPAGTSPVAGRTERVPGFEAVLAITIFLAVYASERKSCIREFIK
ncbi:MAG TPA: S-layer protein domain-containing protein [candidate division Zixibacteria bacterium]|nr:S-layer protein domain-containing protein [candidate division Zixibacteria bacterium]